MLISAWMYGLAGLQFLFLGGHAGWFFNQISHVLSRLPLYPLPPNQLEGGFWRVLAVSMMAMITWICVMTYRGIRGSHSLVPVLLLSKISSTCQYIAFYQTHHELAYLMGALSDGPLFLITLILWIPAMTGEGYLSRTEERILGAMGDALLPKGGAFPQGFADLFDACILDVRKIWASRPILMIVAIRGMMRMLDLSPIWTGYRFTFFRRLPIEQRQEVLRRLESHRWSAIRLIYVSIRFHVLLPFFSQPEVEQAIGCIQEDPS
jgi:hypothetical protein